MSHRPSVVSAQGTKIGGVHIRLFSEFQGGRVRRIPSSETIRIYNANGGVPSTSCPAEVGTDRDSSQILVRGDTHRKRTVKLTQTACRYWGLRRSRV